MSPRKLSDILAELVETHEFLQSLKRLVADGADREALYEADAHLSHAIAELRAADIAWRECDEGRKA